MIKIVIADDHSIVREGIKAMLQGEATIQIAGEASDGEELLSMLPGLQVDIILMDIDMPVMDGIKATEYISTHFPAIHVLALTMLEGEKQVIQLLQKGALGYVLKNTAPEELLYAISMVAAGKYYIDSRISMTLLRNLNPGFIRREFLVANSCKIKVLVTAKDDFSIRELEVLNLIAEGFTNAKIAEQLFVSKRTIEYHRLHLLEKTNSRNTASLIKYALLNGLLRNR
jgi:DNA-binding NarL/FixJ family response regulator